MVAWTGSVDPASNTIPFPNPLPQPPPFSLPSFMIYCEGCEEWFHPECLGMSKREIDKLDNNEAPFICPSCSGESPSFPPLSLQRELRLTPSSILYQMLPRANLTTRPRQSPRLRLQAASGRAATTARASAAAQTSRGSASSATRTRRATSPTFVLTTAKSPTPTRSLPRAALAARATQPAAAPPPWPPPPSMAPTPSMTPRPRYGFRSDVFLDSFSALVTSHRCETIIANCSIQATVNPIREAVRERLLKIFQQRFVSACVCSSHCSPISPHPTPPLPFVRIKSFPALADTDTSKLKVIADKIEDELCDLHNGFLEVKYSVRVTHTTWRLRKFDFCFVRPVSLSVSDTLSAGQGAQHLFQPQGQDQRHALSQVCCAICTAAPPPLYHHQHPLNKHLNHRRVVSGEITPAQLTQMSPSEMANRDIQGARAEASQKALSKKIVSDSEIGLALPGKLIQTKIEIGVPRKNEVGFASGPGRVGGFGRETHGGSGRGIPESYAAGACSFNKHAIHRPRPQRLRSSPRTRQPPTMPATCPAVTSRTRLSPCQTWARARACPAPTPTPTRPLLHPAVSRRRRRPSQPARRLPKSSSYSPWA